MKPINTKERSKSLWQFLFIVFALCFLPIGIIFCAYYETPVEIGREQQEKLTTFTEFEHTQRVLVKQLADIDKDIVSLNNGSNVNAQLVGSNITTAIAKLGSDAKADTGGLIKTLQKTYSDYFVDADRLSKTAAENKKVNGDLLKMQTELKECKDKTDKLDMINAMHSK